MKTRRTLLLAGILLLYIAGSAQKVHTLLSEKLKLHAGAYGLKLVGAGEKWVYFMQKKDKEGLFSSGSEITVPTLTKFNRESLQQESEADYQAPTKGTEFYDIKMLKGRLYLFCTAQTKKDKGLSVSGFEIDPETLQPKAALKELASFDLAEKTDVPKKTVFVSEDSGYFVIAAPLDKELSRIGLTVIDPELNRSFYTVLPMPSRKSFQLATILLSRNQQWIVAGNELAQIPAEKTKTPLVNKGGYIQAYDKAGKKLFSFSGAAGNKTLLSWFVKTLTGNQLLLAGFYTNDPVRRQMEGLSVQRIDLDNGKEINKAFTPFAANADNNKAISSIITDNLFRMRCLGLSPDQKDVILVAESYSEEAMSRVEKKLTGGMQIVDRTNMYYGNVMAASMNLNGAIKWVNLIPKKQVEQVMAWSPTRKASFWNDGYYCFASNDAYFGSFKTVCTNDAVYILFNDNAGNKNVVAASHSPEDLRGAINMSPFVAAIDCRSGRVSRAELMGDPDRTVPLFTQGLMIGNAFYFPTRAHTGLDISRFSYKVGRVLLK